MESEIPRVGAMDSGRCYLTGKHVYNRVRRIKDSKEFRLVAHDERIRRQAEVALRKTSFPSPWKNRDFIGFTQTVRLSRSRFSRSTWTVPRFVSMRLGPFCRLRQFLWTF